MLGRKPYHLSFTIFCSNLFPFCCKLRYSWTFFHKLMNQRVHVSGAFSYTWEKVSQIQISTLRETQERWQAYKWPLLESHLSHVRNQKLNWPDSKKNLSHLHSSLNWECGNKTICTVFYQELTNISADRIALGWLKNSIIILCI